MKKLAKYLLAIPILAAGAFACTPEEVVEDPIKYVLSADEAFENGTATITVTADKAAKTDVEVAIALSKASTIPAEALTFDDKITLKAGILTGEVTVKFDESKLQINGAESAFATFTGAVNGEIFDQVLISATKTDLRGKWSVIGEFSGSNWDKDFVMTAGKAGWYTVEGLVANAGAQFKFRRDGAWDVTFGLDATAVVPVGEEIPVSTKGGNDTNLKLEAAGVYNISLNPNESVAYVERVSAVPMTIAELVSILKTGTSSAPASFEGLFEDLIVTLVAGKTIFIEDETAGVRLYGEFDFDLRPGMQISGEIAGVGLNYLGNMPEVRAITSDPEALKVTAAAALPLTELTVAELNANFDKYLSRRIKLTGVKNAEKDLAKGDNNVSQGEDVIDLNVTQTPEISVVKGSTFDVIGHAVYYDTTKEIKIWNDEAISNVVAPTYMTVDALKEIIKTGTSESPAEFEGLFKDVVITMVSGTDAYVEDETGGILLSGDWVVAARLVAGYKLSGKIAGKGYVYNEKTLQVTALTSSLEDITVEPAELPLTELTVAELKADFDKYAAMRVKLTGVKNKEKDLAAGENNVYQGEDVIALHVDQTPAITVEKNSTFDVIAHAVYDNTTPEVKIWSDEAISNVVAPTYMTVNDLKEIIKTGTQSAPASFEGLFKDIIITMVSGKNAYVEDETGGILLFGQWVVDGQLAAGYKLSGEIAGEGYVYREKTLEVTKLTSSLAAVTVEPAEIPLTELTVAQLNADFDKYSSMRVKLTGVKNAEKDLAKGDNNVSQGEDVIDLYVNQQPAITVEKGSTFDVIGHAVYYNDTKEVKIWNDEAISNVVAPVPVQVPALEYVFGLHTTSETAPWYAAVAAGEAALNAPDQARSIAQDDEYVYLPKSSAYPAVFAIKKADMSITRLSSAGMDTGSTFKTSFARMMKNTDASVNGGKDILLVCNLTAAKEDDGGPVKIFAYSNGIDNAPIQLAAFAYDAPNDTQDWRRYGDRFFVTGTWQDGKIWLPAFNSPKTVVLSVKNGARTDVTQIHGGTYSPDGIKDLTVYPGGSEIFLTNVSIANLLKATGGTANGWQEYTLDVASTKGKGTFGYNFFEFNGKKYIAYARLVDSTHGQIEVIEDQGSEASFVASVDAQAGLLTGPLHNKDASVAAAASSTLVDCSVRVIDGEVYIAGLLQNGGAALYKMVLKDE